MTSTTRPRPSTSSSRRNLVDGGVVSVESEYANYDGLGGYNADYATSEGGYVLGSYLFPKPVGMGKFEILGKYAEANFSKGSPSSTSTTTRRPASSTSTTSSSSSTRA